MRIKKLEHDQENFKKQAIEKAKKGDKKAAALMLRKSKMVEGELVKLEGQSIMLEKQKQLIENSQFDKNTFDAMKARCKTALARNDATAPTEVKLRMAIDAFKTALSK